MQTFDFVKYYCPDKIKVIPGKRLGYGFHGAVYELPGVQDKVIKYSMITECMVQPLQLEIFYKNVAAVLALQASRDYNCYAKVFEYDLLYSGHRTIRSNLKQNFILYSAIFEKLNPLSQDESKLFKTICDASEDGKSNHNHSLKQLAAAQSGWLDFNLIKCENFLDQIERSIIIHGDFQCQNIMKDALGNFKLIDFDFSEIEFASS